MEYIICLQEFSNHIARQFSLMLVWVKWLEINYLFYAAFFYLGEKNKCHLGGLKSFILAELRNITICLDREINVSVGVGQGI